MGSWAVTFALLVGAAGINMVAGVMGYYEGERRPFRGIGTISSSSSMIEFFNEIDADASKHRAVFSCTTDLDRPRFVVEVSSDGIGGVVCRVVTSTFLSFGQRRVLVRGGTDGTTVASFSGDSDDLINGTVVTPSNEEMWIFLESARVHPPWQPVIIRTVLFSGQPAKLEVRPDNQGWAIMAKAGGRDTDEGREMSSVATCRTAHRHLVNSFVLSFPTSGVGLCVMTNGTAAVEHVSNADQLYVELSDENPKVKAATTHLLVCQPDGRSVRFVAGDMLRLGNGFISEALVERMRGYAESGYV